MNDLDCPAPRTRYADQPDYEVYSRAGVLYSRTKCLDYAKLVADAQLRNGIRTWIVEFGPDGPRQIPWAPSEPLAVECVR